MKTQLTKEQVAAIQKEFTAAIQPILQRHGLALQKNNARYTNYDIRVSLVLAINSPDAEAEKARTIHKWSFEDLGIDYGTELTDSRGKVYTAVGFTRNGKLEARRRDDGKVYRAEARFFRLNGKPLQTSLDKQIAESNARNASAKEAR